MLGNELLEAVLSFVNVIQEGSAAAGSRATTGGSPLPRGKFQLH